MTLNWFYGPSHLAQDLIFPTVCWHYQKVFDKLERRWSLLIFPKSQVALLFPVLKGIELSAWKQGSVLFIFLMGVVLGWCLSPQGTVSHSKASPGLCQALIKYQEPSICLCLSSEQAARQSRSWPHMPHYSQSGRGERRKRAACLHETDTKGLLFRSLATCMPKATLACEPWFSLWPSLYSRTLDSDLRNHSGFRMQWSLGEHQGQRAL